MLGSTQVLTGGLLILIPHSYYGPNILYYNVDQLQ